jgi:hypothetical protein
MKTMTHEEASRIPAGREMDFRVAERLGWPSEPPDCSKHDSCAPCESRQFAECICHEMLPYSTEKAAAIWLLDELRKGGRVAEMNLSAGPGWTAEVRVPGGSALFGRGDTYPLAICYAVLMAP